MDSGFEQIVEGRHAMSLFDFPQMSGGLVEWARQDKTHAGPGSPRPEFRPNLWDPRVEVASPLRPANRLEHFGFRLAKGGR
jgi:hypothetical protein